ncbi:MAG: hypothetical protein WCS31_16235 [Verrucomicrobiae bacterium]
MSTITADLPNPVFKSIKHLADTEGMSVEQLASLAISQAVGAWSSQVRIFEERASRGDRAKFDAALAMVPNAKPDLNDEIW